VDIKAYIESGVIESYVLGMADAQEAAELEQLSRQYPEIRKAIDDFEVEPGAKPPWRVRYAACLCKTEFSPT
jgi:hypothetical protein